MNNHYDSRGSIWIAIGLIVGSVLGMLGGALFHWNLVASMMLPGMGTMIGCVIYAVYQSK